MTIAVVKLGVGNTASVMFALERLGADAILTEDARQIGEAERVILPGVGAASFAMQRVDALGLRDTLRQFPRPLLGICLGQQLLFERSEEGDARGLALLPGTVTQMHASTAAPAPHMGWSRLLALAPSPLLDGVSQGAYVYFVHSFVCPLGPATLAEADYNGRFAAVVGRDNVYGCQFHPERSGATGARILANFLALPC
jgi:imidazole glycerol-phosphate synthase subunit HisH